MKAQEESDEDAGATLDDSTLLYRTERDCVGYSVIAIPIGVHDLYLAEAILDVPLTEMLPQMLGTIAIMVIAILFFGILLMLVLHKLISNPIRALQQQIETLAQGDFTVNPASSGTMSWAMWAGASTICPRASPA